MLRSLAVALICSSLACYSPAFAQEPASRKPADQPAQSHRPAPPANGRITGTVFCADTHKPARGALVLLDPAPSTSERKSRPIGESSISRVGVDGIYILDDIVPGDYVISAVLPGYLPPFDGLVTSPADRNAEGNARRGLAEDGQVSVSADKTETVDISLERGAAISGRVLYADGSPAIQVFIGIEDVNATPPGDRSIGLDAFARSMFIHPPLGTDDLGRFRIGGIAPGTYRVVVVQSSSTQPADGPGGIMNLLPGMFIDSKALRIYSGDTLHRKAAKKYELRGEDEVTAVEITLPIDLFHSVRGLLAAKDGRPINKATITLTDSTDDTLVFQGDLERDGTFNFARVPAGTYTLEAKGAEIGKLPDNLPPISSTRHLALRTTNTFADGSTSVIVKDSDVPNVNLTLTEIPLPHAPVTP